MTVAKKGKRTIRVGERAYFWFVAEDLDAEATLALNVISSDKRVMLRYQLVQPEETRFIIVIGPEFRSIADGGSGWRRFRCPQFGQVDLVTPQDVRHLIEWATTNDTLPVEVDWMGAPKK